MRIPDTRNAPTAALSAALIALLACNAPSPQSSGSPAGSGPAKVAAPAAGPSPYVYPPPVKGHYQEVNTGNFDLVDGIAYATQGGTVVYVTSKAIASPMLAGSTCPMTQARAVALIRNAGFVELTLDAKGRSDYFAAGTPYDGRSREQDAGGGYWKLSGGKLQDGRIAGSVAYKGHGGFDYDLPVAKPGVSEADSSRRKPTEAELTAAYDAVHRAALAKDLKAMLAAQGFDAKQIDAIQRLPGIDADLAAHADRFLAPGAAEEPTLEPGMGRIGGQGKNSKGAAFFNFYEFAPCGDELVLVGIGLNPQ